MPGDRLALREGVADAYLLRRDVSAGVMCVECVVLLPSLWVSGAGGAGRAEDLLLCSRLTVPPVA